jgi:hypothetical protein
MAKKSTTTSTETVSKQETVDPRVEKYNQLKELSLSLVKEVDNVFMSRLAPGALGSVLGKVMKNYKLQVEKIDIG